jgi:seryl-tRNA synthetase
MLDIQLLRTDLAAVAKRLDERGFKLDTAVFEALEAERKKVQTDTQDLQRNGMRSRNRSASSRQEKKMPLR